MLLKKTQLNRWWVLGFATAWAIYCAAASPVKSAATPAYAVTRSIGLGSPDRWDFLSFDPTSHRVYATHNTEIVVVDARSGDIVGRIGGLAGANGVAIVPEIGKGYTASRGKRQAIAFDLATLKIVKEMPAEPDTDAVIYDPASKRVFVMNGDPHSITVLDTTTDTMVARISLPGVPEYAVVDGEGSLYVNVMDRREISRIDTQSAHVSASWPISECEKPHGLSMDSRTHRLFASCLNRKLVVVDSASGHLIATLPIGEGSDGTAFDPNRGFIFSSNGGGTLSVIREEGPDNYISLGEIQTQRLARTIAVDQQTGRVFLVSADTTAAKSSSSSPVSPPAIRPGSVHLLFIDPPPPLRHLF